MESPIEPTVGRIVLVRDSAFDETLAAIVTKVWNRNCINVCAFTPHGSPIPLTSVTYDDSEAPASSRSFHWMPYQRQAAGV